MEFFMETKELKKVLADAWFRLALQHSVQPEDRPTLLLAAEASNRWKSQRRR